MAGVHSCLLPSEYKQLAEERIRVKGVKGVIWKVDVDWSQHSVDMATNSSWESECKYMRRLHWYIKLKASD